MDTTSFEDWLILDQTWVPVTVQVMLKRMRFAQKHGLVFEPWDPSSGRSYLRRRLETGCTIHAYNNDVKMLNAWHLYKTGQRSQFRGRKKPRSQYKFLTADQVRLVLTYRHKDPAQERLRRALFWWAIKSAMRVSEISAMNMADLDFEHSRFFVRKPAKRGLQRWLPMEPWFWSPKRPFLAYLKQRPVPKDDPHAVWTTTYTGNGNTRQPRRLSPKAMTDELRDMARSLGLPTLNFIITRHTRATELRQQGWDLLLIREYLGHSSVKSTEVYAAVLPTDVSQMMRRRPGRDPFQNKDRET